MAYFSFKFFFSIFVSNQRKKLSKMATFTFRLLVGDHIFFICSLKNHMKNMWSPSRKVKVAILLSFFVDLKQILKKKFERKIRHFFIMFGTFIQNFS